MWHQYCEKKIMKKAIMASVISMASSQPKMVLSLMASQWLSASW